ncbi:MAG: FAD-binding protein [Chloroflexota bacterium]
MVDGRAVALAAGLVRNWAGTHTYAAARLRQPESIDELQAIVRDARRVRALGSRHSFNDIADTEGDLVALARLPRSVQIEPVDQSVTVDGGARYGDVCGDLHAAGLALHNLASLPHISIAGACVTGTHGSGVRSGSLSTAVEAVELVGPDGELRWIDAGRDPDLFAAVVVSLGALGIVSRLRLRVEPTYDVAQEVFEDLPLDDFRGHFEEIAALGDSVSYFTGWRGPWIDQVWVKRRVASGGSIGRIGEIFGATRAAAERHPIRSASADACTPQLGVPGPWHERLPHFRLDHTPSSGEEIQSEYFVGRDDAVAAFDALDMLREAIAPLVHVSEIRTIAADELWLSPAYRRPSVAFHFTWKRQPGPVLGLLPKIEAALEPFAPRPHWGKVFSIDPRLVAARYPRRGAFAAAATRLDPEAKFRNVFVDRYLFSPPA